MRRSAVLLLAAALLALPARALPPQLLKQLDALPPAERARVQQQVRQWRQMPADRQQALRQRAVEWDALEPAVKQARRAAWQTWQALPEADRARLRATAAVYARMPETQRHALGERYAALDAHERDGWRLGPVLGADWPQLHGLFALVPDDQRLALLAMLRSLDDSARADLAMIAQRTPPEERDALRRRLLSMPEAARADWLRVQASPN